MSTEDVRYIEYDEQVLTECSDCPYTSTSGYYVWCPNCGSDDVTYDP